MDTLLNQNLSTFILENEYITNLNDINFIFSNYNIPRTDFNNCEIRNLIISLS